MQADGSSGLLGGLLGGLFSKQTPQTQASQNVNVSLNPYIQLISALLFSTYVYTVSLL